MRIIFIVTPGYKKVEADMNKKFFLFCRYILDMEVTLNGNQGVK